MSESACNLLILSTNLNYNYVIMEPLDEFSEHGMRRDKEEKQGLAEDRILSAYLIWNLRKEAAAITNNLQLRTYDADLFHLLCTYTFWKTVNINT